MTSASAATGAGRGDDRDGRTLARILSSHGIAWSSVEYSADAHINRVARVDGTWVVRFSPDPSAGARFGAEAQLLERVRAIVPTAEVRHVGELDDVAYQVLRYVDVDNLADCWLQLPRDQKRSIADHLADILRALHDVVFDDFGPLCPPERGFSSWKECQLSAFRCAIEDLRQCDSLISPSMLDAAVRFFVDRSGCLDGHDRPALVHNDCWPGNLLVADGRVTALLDFELAQKAPRDAEIYKLESFCSAPELYSKDGNYRDLFDAVVSAYPEIAAAASI